VIADPLGEVGHVLVPDVGRERVDADQVQVVEVNGVLTVDPEVGRPEGNLSGPRIDQPAMLVARLVGKSVSDLLQVQIAQIKHRTRVVRCFSNRRSVSGGSRRSALGGGGSHGGNMVVQLGLEPAGDALTSAVPRCWISSDRSRTISAQVRGMIRKRVDHVHQHPNRSILIPGPEITVRPVATRASTRDDVQ